MGTLRASRPGNRVAGRSLRRYVHTQGFTRLSGNRRVELRPEHFSARLALGIVATMILFTGLYFICF